MIQNAMVHKCIFYSQQSIENVSDAFRLVSKKLGQVQEENEWYWPRFSNMIGFKKSISERQGFSRL